MSTTILYVRPEGGGWGPITAMASLSARLLQADLITMERRELGRVHKARALLPRLRGAESLLVISPVPESLNFIALVPGLRRHYGTVIGWVVDCWWTNRIPVAVTRGHLYDRLLVTEKEVVDDWRRVTRMPVEWVPLGADVLGALRERGRAGDYERTVDLQRMGRQPEAWDDDELVAAMCEHRGLAHGPRPPFGTTPEGSYANVLAAAAGARSLLAFTNLASPAGYTHPSREYVTSRWLDALALGALVVGQRPREEGSDELLWEGATLDVSPTNVAAGLDALAAELTHWTPERADAIQDQALRRLDWRWRLREVAELLDVASPVLDAELRELREALAGR